MKVTSAARKGSQSKRPAILAPLMVLCLFAAVLPTHIAGRSAGITNEECLTLADGKAAVGHEWRSRLEHCSAVYPDDVELLAELAVAYESLDRAKAERTYRRALELDPDYAELRLRFGRLLLLRGAAEDAFRQAEAGLRIQPNRHALLRLRDEAQRAGAKAGP